MAIEVSQHYFSPSEYGDSWQYMDPRILVLTDALRHIVGPIHISPHPRALARFDGDDESQHNVDRWGACRAKDVFVMEVRDREDVRDVIDGAAATSITGIGIYPDWTYNGERRTGFHLDSRRDRSPGDPALWGMVDDGEGQYQVSFEKALERMA